MNVCYGLCVFGLSVMVVLFAVVLSELIINGLGCNIQEYTYPGLYKNDIPKSTLESFYSFNNYPKFERSVKDGLNTMKTKTVVICALARNIEKTFPKCMEKIVSLGTDFKNYRIVIFENDSSDKTRDRLTEWTKKNPNIILMECPGHRDCKLKMPHPKTTSKDLNMNDRMVKMAGLRNKYLDYVKANFSHYDYMVVYDLDSRGGVYLDGYRSVFSKINDWDSVYATGLKPVPVLFGKINVVYDVIAFVEKGNAPMKNKNDVFSHFYKYQKVAKKSAIDDEPIRVSSAFNGLGIYKMQSVLKAKYDSNTICEHIDFNRSFSNQFISPSLILINGIDTETELPIKVAFNWFR